MDNLKKIFDTNYLVFNNGVLEETDTSLSSLTFDEPMKVKVINRFSKDATVKYVLNADVTIEEIIVLEKDVTVEVVIECAENVKFNYTRLLTSTGANVQMNVNAVLQRESYINNKSIMLLSSNGKIHEDVKVSENGNYENTNVIVNGTNLIQDYVVDITLTEAMAKSEMVNYSICKEKSILNVFTNGIINKNAKQTVLGQKTKGLLLDEESAISANPQLVIDEFDCLASHGAGIGAIDEDELYYLMSRGLSREESERLIIGGFINPVLNAIEDEKFSSYVQEQIKKFL